MIPHAQVLFGGLMFAVATLVATIFWLMPGWSRPGIFFAVTMAPSFRGSPDAARVVRSCAWVQHAHNTQRKAIRPAVAAKAAAVVSPFT